MFSFKKFNRAIVIKTDHWSMKSTVTVLCKTIAYLFRMGHLASLSICFIIVFHLNFIKISDGKFNSDVKFENEENSTKILQLHSEIIQLIEIPSTTNLSTKASKTYEFGNPAEGKTI